MRTLLFALALSAVPQTAPRPRLVVVYGADVDPAMLENLSRRPGVTYLEAAEAKPEQLREGPLALVGTARDNPWLRALDIPGLAVSGAGFTWQGVAYDRASDVLQLRGMSPFNPTHSLELVVGDLTRPLQRRRADVQIRRDGFTALLGFRREDGGFATRTFARTVVPIRQDDSLRIFSHGAAATSADLARLSSAVGDLPRRVDVHIYPSLEVKGLVTDDTRAAHERDGAFHVVLGVDSTPARVIVESTLASGSLLERRGEATVRTYDSSELDRLDEVSRRLLLTSDPPSIVSLADDASFQDASPFVTDAISASFARFSDERDEPLPARAEAWANSLRRRPPGLLRGFSLPSTFHRGFTFAHEGYQIHNGYLSERSRESLERLSANGIDAVAVIPYAFMTDPHVVTPLEVPRRSGSETDEDVIQAIRNAVARDMTVMLKPQIWIRGSWPGDIEPDGSEATARFFDEYRRWILHYALLADAEQVPLFAIGTELAKLTRGNEPHWRRLIADVRCVYRGQLVYAANWGEEVQHVRFWDLLDYIGVDFYYPLSFDERPSDEELAGGFRDALAQIREIHERYDKPVLLTEIGYASTAAPWRAPHVSDRDRAVSPEDQARAYEIAFRALESETDWIRGMYWWKWPTDLSRGGATHRGFTPNGKPAETVVRRWYRDRFD